MGLYPRDISDVSFPTFWSHERHFFVLEPSTEAGSPGGPIKLAMTCSVCTSADG